jgi:sulfate adenylyltransferase large subunit
MDASVSLRMATAGSVDDGKSTLIGRLLHDTKTIFEDQWRAVERASRRWGGELNLALLTDGLRAEREQGITIDVAHRYFATPRRSFIVADSPGHPQYTRNMVTAASTADVAVVLVDARHGVTEQTRRHAFIAALVGVGQIVLAVNKMDLVGWDVARYDAVARELAEYLGALPSAPPLVAVPVSALHGDNVVEPSSSAPWYGGPPLLELLEKSPALAPPDLGARLDVQWCIRHPPTDFRGVAGRLSGGPLVVGDEVTIAPAGTTTRITHLARGGRAVTSAEPGQAITAVFADHVDVARGDVVLGGSDAGPQPVSTTEVEADVCWMTEAPLVPGARVWFKHGTRTGSATMTAIGHRVDVTTLSHEPAERLELNDLARITLRLASPIVALPYRQHREAGRLVLVDPADHATAAAAMIATIS